MISHGRGIVHNNVEALNVTNTKGRIIVGKNKICKIEQIMTRKRKECSKLILTSSERIPSQRLRLIRERQ
jgi:hypothetical protein